MTNTMIDQMENFPDRKICILGLGYVGLTLAAVMASVGYRVIGVELRDDVLEQLRQNTAHFHEPGLNEMLARACTAGLVSWHKHIPRGCDATVFIITVGTPLDQHCKVRLDMIERVAREIAEHSRTDALVIMRSTVMVGTTSNLVLPILRAANKNLSVAFCPERTVEGHALSELRELPQIVGAAQLDVAMRATQIFQFLTPTVIRVSTYETAEMIKLIDNAQRDVMFAFANEVATMCDLLGISADEVIRSGRHGYVRHNVPLPGPVGGPCLSKDPYILEQSMAPHNSSPGITVLARKTNEAQLKGIAHNLRAWTNRFSSFPDRPVISLLGLAFKGKPATDDLRGTTAKPIFEELRILFPSAQFRGYDAVVAPPVIAEFGCQPCYELNEAFDGASLVLILNNHPVFETLPLDRLSRRMHTPGLIYDLWNHFKAKELQLPEGIGYAALGSHGLAVLPHFSPVAKL